MRHAIALSALGHGTTSSNPPVGCVVFDENGHVLGQGWHRRKGESHAEAHAVAQAGSHARAGTAVVTLEPCCHHGRTPPCHQTLIDAGIARVVIAVLDPTSRGRGGAALPREAGIDVTVGVLADEARLVPGPWLTALDHQRPVLTWGCTLTPEGTLTGKPTVLPREVDTLVHDGGAVPEPGSPGTATPLVSLPQEPRHALDVLYRSGTRTAGLAVAMPQVRPYLHADLVDHIEIRVPADMPSALVFPDGYRLTGTARLPKGVWLSMSRDDDGVV
nr:bifunctional diaminohydroxyphosphoribosylaminopyrimidine deaminase/5-amino-6-(5-phosphoribosylamino)uracil reductase RibD [Actinopolyspora mortivallis]